MQREIDVPAWGPYSRNYAGVSRMIKGELSDQMIDFIPVPGYVRGKAVIPDLHFDSGYHFWMALPDLSYYSIRYDLAWKDLEYCQAEYFAGNKGHLIKMTFVNNSDMPKEYFATVFAVHRYWQNTKVTLLSQESWVDGKSYVSLAYQPPAELLPKGENYETFCHLNYLGMGHDGIRRGVVIQPIFVNGQGLGNCASKSAFDALSVECNRTFLMNEGTRVAYQADGNSFRNIALRMHMENIERLELCLKVDDKNYPIVLTGNQVNPWRLVNIALPGEAVQEIILEVTGLTAHECPGFVLDGFLLGQQAVDPSRFIPAKHPPRFDVRRTEGQTGVTLTSNLEDALEVAMYSPCERPRPPKPYSDCTITNVYHSDLSGSRVLRKLNNDSMLNWGIHNVQIEGDGQNHFCGYNIAPVVCPSHSKHTVWIALACDCQPNALSNAQDTYAHRYDIEKSIRQVVEEYRRTLAAQMHPNPYSFSQEKLMTHLYTNVTFPVYIEDGFYHTYTPGKRWGGLFTWDSGMLGIGMVQYAPKKALEIIRQYLVDVENIQTDAILHGTQLPLHVYLMLEWYQHTGDKDTLRTLYPSLRKYFRYFTGQSELSTYDKFHTGLLCPFEDGYNVEGIDDYPPQHYTGLIGGYARYSPVCTSAHAIRTAKIMSLFAKELEMFEEIADYEQWQNYWEKALQTYSWEEQSGYYAYVENGTMDRLYYDEAKTVNYNMGIDGLSPLLSGILTETQLANAKEHLLCEGHMWTSYGITSVDMRAPYARTDGYWNGKVWIPHQWFFWKALISEGELDGAEQIARKALQVWRNSVEDTYNCYEQFCILTGMGEGCHNFGGLSAPLAAFWFAYYGRRYITVGWDCLLKDVCWTQDTAVKFTLVYHGNRTRTGILVCVGKEGAYRVSISSRTFVQSAKDGILNLVIDHPQYKQDVIVQHIDLKDEVEYGN